MTRTSILILLFPLLSYGQGDRYRFQMSLGLHSIINYGTKSFDRVEYEPFTKHKYEREWYDIDYKNGTSSIGFFVGLSVNWVNKPKYLLRQNCTFFGEFYQEELTFTLVDYQIGDSAYYPDPTISDEVAVGYSGTVIMQGFSMGTNQETIYLRKLNNGWMIGGGIGFVYRARVDKPTFQVDYMPYTYPRGLPGYLTQQVGLIASFEKQFDRWSCFVNFNQAIFTVKKPTNKGAYYFYSDWTKYPISHNLDFRFPLTIQFGAAFQFDRIKN